MQISREWARLSSDEKEEFKDSAERINKLSEIIKDENEMKVMIELAQMASEEE